MLGQVVTHSFVDVLRLLGSEHPVQLYGEDPEHLLQVESHSSHTPVYMFKNVPLPQQIPSIALFPSAHVRHPFFLQF